MRAVLTVLLAALALSACDGGGDPVEQALRETAAANQSATVREAATTSAASDEPADAAYVARMIEHHRGAIAMAEAALRESHDPEIRRMAEAAIDDRTREIAEMMAWKPAPAN